MRTAVIGHVEWGRFLRVDRLPEVGDIVHAAEAFDIVAGGGPVAAVQLLKLAGDCTFYTALGDDELGHLALEQLSSMGVRVAAVWRESIQREAIVHVDANGERTITVIGTRLGPRADDPLPWSELPDVDAVYFCAGDDDALKLARRARAVVATSREAERIARAGVQLDAVVGSASDPSETYIATEPTPGVVVATQGDKGGRFVTADGKRGRYKPGTLPGPVVCTYGAGDSFAAGLTYGLGAEMDVRSALALASRCGAANLTGRGPYEGQLTSADLETS